MHVVYISQDGVRPSGITTYGCLMLGHLDEAWMLLLNADAPPPVAPDRVVNRIRFVEEAGSHDVRVVAQRLAELIAELPGNVVVLPNVGDTPWAATIEFLRSGDLATRARVRVLGVVHSDVETQYAGAVRHAAVVPVWIGVSRRCAVELRRRLPGHDVLELPYPMPLPDRPADGNPSGRVRLIYAGRLEEPQKRVSRLAAVFDELARMGLPYTAVVAGDGPARPDFESALAAGAARTAVRCIGAVDRRRLEDLLGNSDIFLLTSAYEGLPLALLEAMAAGVCPVVMRIDSGLWDAIEPGSNAIVVEQGDIGAMVRQVVDLAGDRSRLQRLKRAARETVAQRFSPGVHFARLKEAFDSCMAAQTPDADQVSSDPTAEAVASLLARARTTGRPVVVYGAGMFGRKVVDACLDAGVRVAGWVDSDAAKTGSRYRDLVCAGPEAIEALAGCVFLIGSIEFAAEISRRIESVAAACGAHSPQIISVQY